MTKPADPGQARQPRDPKALRALAHPMRWKLLDLLGSETTATATRCAEVLGESEASCSYHLRILAKYGYVSRVPHQEGREKPWRLTSPEQDLSPVEPGIDGALAATAVMEVFLDHELAKLKARLRRSSLEPASWQRATCVQGDTTWLTAEELQRVSAELREIISRYQDRIGDSARRPAGSREVRLLVATTVAPAP